VYSSFLGSLVATAAATGFAIGRKLKRDAQEREAERQRVEIEMISIKTLITTVEERFLDEYCMNRLTPSLIMSILRETVLLNIGEARWTRIRDDEALSREIVKYATERSRCLSELKEPQRVKALNTVRERILSRSDILDDFGRIYARYQGSELKSQIFYAFCEIVYASDAEINGILEATERDLIFKEQLVSVICAEAKNATKEAKLNQRISQSVNLSGIEFEALCRDILFHNGWRVNETKKTGDQGVDLVAQSTSQRLCFQCKRQSAPVGNAAVQQVYAGLAFYKCDEAYVVSNAGYTASSRDLANAVGVKLINITDLLAIKANA